MPVDHQVNGAVLRLGSMLTGTVLYRWFAGQARRRAAIACVVSTLVCGLVTLLGDLYGKARPSDPAVSHFWPLLAVWSGAYLIFLTVFALRRFRFGWLAALGTISYSIYLMHPAVLVSIPLPPDTAAAFAVAFLSVLAASALSYQFIEHPAIRIARRLANAESRRLFSSHATPVEEG